MDIQTLLHVAEGIGVVFVAATIMTITLLGLDWMYHLHAYIRAFIHYWRTKLHR